MTTSTTVNKPSNTQIVYETIKEEILCLTLAPGSLIDELSISKRFSFSRSPVREAFIRLAAEGLIKTLPNKSSQVSPLEIEDFPSFIDALDLIQRAVTRLAAINRSDEQLENIKEQNNLYIEAVVSKDVSKMINKNYDFHISVSEACRNSHFQSMYMRLLNEGRRTLRIYYRSFNDTPPLEGIGSHAALIKAIEVQDADQADCLAHQHTNQLKEGFIKYLTTRKTSDMVL